MNRGTIGLLAILLVVIVAVLVISSQQASAPGETPTPSTVSGALLPGVAAESIVRFEVRDNTTGDFTTMTKDSGGAWLIDATNALEGRDPEQALINTTTGQLVAINYTNLFEDDDLATYGLDHPAYTVFITTADQQFYTIYVGAKSPTSSRYYAVVDQTVLAEETQTSDSGTAQDGDDNDQAIATMDVSGEGPNEEGVQPPDAEETQEPTDEASGDAGKRPSQAQATEEAPDDQAIATLDIESENPNEEGVLPDGTDEVTSEATVETTEQAPAVETLEATAEPIENPQVTLEGTQTIYLIPQTVIDTLTRWLTTPPYAAAPTAAPTAMGGTPAAGDEATGVEGTVQSPPIVEEGGDTDLIEAGTPVMTQGAPEDATAEATAGS